MTQFIEFIKNTFILMIVLLMFSYLVPKEKYKKYFQHFISVWILILLIQPLFQIFFRENNTGDYFGTETLKQNLNEITFSSEEGSGVIEEFFLEQ